MATSLSATISGLTTYTFTHSLNRLDLSVRLIGTDGEIVNNFLSQVIPDPANPKNILIINFTSAFTGRVQIVTLDLVQIAELVRNAPTVIGINNLSASTSPSTSNNLLQGYTIGSQWYNTVTQDLFICTLSNIATAQWTWQYNNIKYITLEKTAANQTFTTTLADVTWQTTSQNVTDYYTFGSNRITLNQAGEYRINFGFTSLTSQSQAVVHRVVITRTRSAVDNVINRSESYLYFEQSNIRASTNKLFVDAYLASDQIRMQVQVFSGGATTHTIQTQGTFLQIERVG
jgi:hypothetical protein